VSAVLRGEGEASGQGEGLSFEGRISSESRVATKVGPEARRALRAKPRFRDIRHEIDPISIVFEAPSYWIRIPANDPSIYLLRHTLETAGIVQMVAQPRAIPDVSIDEIRVATLQDMERRAGRDIPSKRVSHPVLGNGFTTEVPVDSSWIYTHFYKSQPGLLFAFQLQGNEEACRKHMKEFEKTLASIVRE